MARVRAQVHGSAVLAAAGLTPVLLLVSRELAFHLWPPAAMAATVLATCAGALVGLWWPRRILRARFPQDVRDAPGALVPAGGAVARATEFEFAASLTGGLIVALALVWAAIGGYALGLESWRHWLVTRFAYPPWLTQLLLAAPALLGLVLAGALGSVVLMALHGWHRLTHGCAPRVTALWLGLIGGAAGGALVSVVVSRPAAQWLAALLATLASGIVAVCRRSAGAAAPEPPPTQRDVLRGERRLPVAAAVFAAGVGSALCLAGAGADARGEAAVAVVLGGLLLGAIAAHRLPHSARSAARELGPWLAAGAVAWILSLWGDGERFGAWTGPGLVGIAAGGGLVVIGRRLVQVRGRIQHALTTAGAAGVIGLAAGALVTATCTWTGTPAAGMAPPRAWLPMLRDDSVLRAACDPRAAWDVDLGGARADVVIAEVPAAGEAALGAADLVRFLRRCATALRPGGRLVVDAPLPVLRTVDGLLAGARVRPGAQAHLVWADDAAAGMLVLGEDVAAWMTDHSGGRMDGLHVVPLAGRSGREPWPVATGEAAWVE